MLTLTHEKKGIFLQLRYLVMEGWYNGEDNWDSASMQSRAEKHSQFNFTLTIIGSYLLKKLTDLSL